MNKLKLFRQRFIPAETILLKDDIIVSQTEDMLITSWKTLNPKTEQFLQIGQLSSLHIL